MPVATVEIDWRVVWTFVAFLWKRSRSEIWLSGCQMWDLLCYCSVWGRCFLMKGLSGSCQDEWSLRLRIMSVHGVTEACKGSVSSVNHASINCKLSRHSNPSSVSPRKVSYLASWILISLFKLRRVKASYCYGGSKQLYLSSHGSSHLLVLPHRKILGSFQELGFIILARCCSISLTLCRQKLS